MSDVYLPTSPSGHTLLPHGDDLAGKTLLVVLTSGVHRTSVYETLKKLGVRLILVNPCKNWAESLSVEWILTEVIDIKVMCENVLAHLSSIDATVDGVLTFDEYGTYACAELGKFLGCINTPATPDVVARTVVKTQLRSHLVAGGLNAPRSATIRSLEQLKQLEKAGTIGLTFPLIVKPSMGGGGVCVKIVGTFADLVATAGDFMHKLLNHADAKYWTAYSTLHILVEEYIVGDEVDVDCIVQDGVLKYAAISDNKPTTAPYFREVGGVAPTQLSPRAQEAILSELEKWVASHGTSVNGLLHYEARYNAATNRSYTIEVNMRLGGAESLTLNQEAWGVSLPVAAAMIALGQRVPDLTHLSRNARRSVSSINFVPETNGLLVRQEIPQTVVDDPAFAGACLYETPGSFVASPPVRFTCLGWLCAYGDDGVASEQELARLVSQVTFDITQNIDPEAPVTAAVAEAQAQTEQQFTQPPNDALTKCPVTGDSVCRCAVAA
eukprot:Rhum_TRINITY_DN12581_c1_g1::Rhum_TRINITY_DN12581_c1_g1_i2::g.52971::m.52971